MLHDGYHGNRRGSCRFQVVLPLLILSFISACGDDNDHNAGLQMEAGYFVIEPVNFTLRSGGAEAAFTSAETRLWYEFQPAKESPQDKPLVLLFNGGPGCATHFLFGFGTATWVVAPDTPDLFENPYTWRQFANLLYIDARGAGFSYGMTQDPASETTRIAEFDTKNYNVFLDAGDFIRLLLRFLAHHPSIQRNPVVIVGESYGGTRSTAMLSLLLRYSEYGGAGEVYQDVSLAEEIRHHLDVVFPREAGSIHPPETIATQFGHQILIEPLITGNNQFVLSGQAFEREGSIIHQIADETGTTYVPCDPQDTQCDPFDNAMDFLTNVADRDYYVYPKPANWTFEEGYLAINQLTTVEGLRQMTQIDPTTVTDLFAKQRNLAYRVGKIDTGVGADPLSDPRWERLPPFARYFVFPYVKGRGLTAENNGELPRTFGNLNPWDGYHIDCSFDALNAFYSDTATSYGIDPTNDRFGEMFLHDLIYVDTFITRAGYDLIIYAPVIPDSIAAYDQYVQRVDYIATPIDDEKRPGWIEVTYKDGAFGVVTGNATRMIRFPTFAESGHTVELNQPGALFEESRDWLASTKKTTGSP